ncbi:golgin subfamily A member 4-like [Penaeus japonicus]|uniref:golgin subfamily A member 4-like n=1 Tax=Penaeus japonicus TaxID=27405 RepID=UPI001C7115B6|nr:golgin subfamily A member 4-like [Penaeus japonicus]
MRDFPARSSPHTALATNCSDRREGTLAMENLHEQLQQEVEDLFRWKASTEIHTQHLERQLNEAQMTIADQRRNLMELQLSSEKLTQSLLRERHERNQIAAKVTRIRQLSYALEQQKGELVVTLSHFQQEKQLLSVTHKCTIQRINELTEAFHNLYEAHKQHLDRITAQGTLEVSQLQKQNASKEQELNKLKESLSRLVQSQSAHEEKIVELTKLLETTEGRLSCAQEKNTALESEIVEVKNSLEIAQKEIDEQRQASTVQLNKLQEELKDEKCRRVESQKEFEEAVEKIQYLKKTNDTLEGSKSEILEKLEAVTTRKQELEKDLSHGSNMMAALRTGYSETTQQVYFLSQCLEEMRAKFSGLDSDFQDVQVERQSLIVQLDESKGLLLEEQNLVCHLKEKILELTQDLAIKNVKEEERKTELQTYKGQNDEHLSKAFQEKANVAVKHQDDVAFAAEKKLSTLGGDVKTLTGQLLHGQSAWPEDHETYEQKVQTIIASVSEAEAQLEQQISEIEDRGQKIAREEEMKEQQRLIKSLKVQIKQLEKELKSKARTLAQEVKKREKTEASSATWKRKFQSKELERDKLHSDLQETLRGQGDALKLQGEKQKALEEICKLQVSARTHEANMQERQQKVVDLQDALEAAFKELKDLRGMVDVKDKEFEGLKFQSNEAMMNLASQLQAKEEELVTSSSICDQLQGDVASLKRCMEEQRSKHVVEVEALKEEVDEAKKEVIRAKQEMVKVNKEGENVLQEADTKVKDMLSIIEQYRPEDKTNKKITTEFLETQQRLTMNGADIADVSTANEVTYFPTDELATPSPRQYLSYLFPLRESHRKVPTATATLMPHSPGAESPKRGRKRPGILKKGLRRTLVPPTEQKHVVFKSPLPQASGSNDGGDSSPDANTCMIKSNRYRLRSCSAISPRKRRNVGNQQAKTAECSPWITTSSSR